MREKIKTIMKSVFELPDIPDDISMDNCEQWDSLHHLSLVIELEALFNVSFKLQDTVKMKNLEAIENVLKNKNII